MTVFVIISVFVCIGLELLSRARQNIDTIKDQFLHNVQSAVRDENSDLSEESETAYSGQHTAIRKPRRRKDLIIHTYCEQMHGGVEETPVDRLSGLKS